MLQKESPDSFILHKFRILGLHFKKIEIWQDHFIINISTKQKKTKAKTSNFQPMIPSPY